MHLMMNSTLMNISTTKMTTIIRLVMGGKKCKSMTNRPIRNYQNRNNWLVNTQVNSNSNNKNNNNTDTINNINHNNKGISIRKRHIFNKELISIIMISIMKNMM